MNTSKLKKRGAIAGILLMAVMVGLIPVFSYVIYFRAGTIGAWAPLYLGTLDNPILIETDYESGHEFSPGLITDVINVIDDIIDRPIVHATDYTDCVNLPDSFLDPESGMVDHGMINALRDTYETWDTIYILFSNNVYELNDDLVIGGLYSAPGCIVVMMASGPSLTDKYTIIHEVGHLLGVDHCDDPDCYMYPVLDPADPPTHWCGEHLEQLDQLRGYPYRGDTLVVIICSTQGLVEQERRLSYLVQF